MGKVQFTQVSGAVVALTFSLIKSRAVNSRTFFYLHLIHRYVSVSSTCFTKWGFVWNVNKKPLHLVPVQHRLLFLSLSSLLVIKCLPDIYLAWEMEANTTSNQETRFRCIPPTPQTHWKNINLTCEEAEQVSRGCYLLSSLTVVLVSCLPSWGL